MNKIETVRVQGGKEHPTYAGVLNKAHEEGLTGIKTEMLQFPSKENEYVCIIHATVTMVDIRKDGELQTKTFDGIGDASPRNVNQMIVKHLIRMAETRAKGRALRDAVNITDALKEEID